MKSQIKFIEEFRCAFLMFENGVTGMHHSSFAGSHANRFGQLAPEARLEACKNAAIDEMKKLQPSVEEGLAITPPKGFVFAGVSKHTDPRDIAAGFRTPARNSKEEKQTDARLGKATWLLYRLPTGLDATFVPRKSDWENKFAAPRGAAASVTKPHQLVAVQQ